MPRVPVYTAAFGASGGGGGGQVSYEEIGIESASGWETHDWDLQIGYEFTVGGSDIEVGALRIRHSDTTPVEHTLRLWRDSDQALLVEVDITPAQDDWAEVSITPVTLSSGSDYRVTQRAKDGSTRTIVRNPSSLTVNSAITKNGNLVFISGDGYPDSTSSHDSPTADIVFRVP